MSHSKSCNPMGKRAVIHPAMILKPSRMVRILVQVLRRNVVVLPSHHAPKARKEALNLIGVGAGEVAVRLAVVDAVRGERAMQGIPVRGFIGIEGRVGIGDALGDFHALGFRPTYQSEGPTAALTQGDDYAALAGLVPSKAAVNAVFLDVRRADVTAEVGAINLDTLAHGLRMDFGRHGFPELVGEDERGLVLAIEVAGKLKGRDALG